MSNEVKKKKRHLKKWVKKLLLLIIIISAAGISIINPKLLKESPIIINPKTYYLASSNPILDLYKYDEETKKIEKVKEIARGLEITTTNKFTKIDEKYYLKVKIDDKNYYVLKENIVTENLLKHL